MQKKKNHARTTQNENLDLKCRIPESSVPAEKALQISQMAHKGILALPKRWLHHVEYDLEQNIEHEVLLVPPY